MKSIIASIFLLCFFWSIAMSYTYDIEPKQEKERLYLSTTTGLLTIEKEIKCSGSKEEIWKHCLSYYVMKLGKVGKANDFKDYEAGILKFTFAHQYNFAGWPWLINSHYIFIEDQKFKIIITDFSFYATDKGMPRDIGLVMENNINSYRLEEFCFYPNKKLKPEYLETVKFIEEKAYQYFKYLECK